ncbi:hypothetical protein, partial [Sphingomonas faeni]|uniref:hypothetical protein n=1 Tax=Sphingomonas faeni TaxID=185950 RepID=UPI001AC000AE
MSKQHFANGVIGASLLDAFEQCQSRTRITNANGDEVYTSRPQITLALIRPMCGRPSVGKLEQSRCNAGWCGHVSDLLVRL